MKQSRSGPFGYYVMVGWSRQMHKYQRDYYSRYMYGYGLKFEALVLTKEVYGSVWGVSYSYNGNVVSI